MENLNEWQGLNSSAVSHIELRYVRLINTLLGFFGRWSVTTRIVIGCGIYRDKLHAHRLAREYNLAWISGHIGEKISCFFLVKTAYIFNSLNSRRTVFTAFPDFSNFI